MSQDDKFRKPDGYDKALGVQDAQAKQETFDRGFQDWLNQNESEELELKNNSSQEQSENGEKKDLNESSLTPDENGGSNSATKVCEVCNSEDVNCLCKVTFTNQGDGEIYTWKGGKGDLVKGDAARIVLFETFDSESKRVNSENTTIDFEIIGECEESSPQTCCYFYYFEEGPKQWYSPMKVGDKVDDVIEGCKVSGSTAIFPFNRSRLTDKPIEKGEEKDSEDQKGKFIYISVDKNASHDEQNNKNNKITIVEKSDVPQYVFGELPTNPKVVATFIARILNFTLESKINYFPVTKYHIGVLECVGQKHLSKSFLEDKNNNAKTSEGNYGRALAEVYTIPDYKVDYNFSINFDGKEISKEKVHAFCGVSGEIVKKEMGLTLEGEAKEYFYGVPGGTYKNTLDLIAAKDTLLQSGLNTLKMIADLIQGINTIQQNLKVAEKMVETVAPSPLSFNLKYPTMTFGTKNAQLQLNNKKELIIEREASIFKLKPGIGAEIKLDILAMLCTFFGGPFAKALNSLKSGSGNLGIAEFEYELKAIFKISFGLSMASESVNPSLTINKNSMVETDGSSKNSAVNEDPKTFVELSFSIEPELEVSLNVKARVVFIYGALSVGFKINAEMVISFKQSKKTGEWGHVIEFSGASFIWIFGFSFGIVTEDGRGSKKETEAKWDLEQETGKEHASLTPTDKLDYYSPKDGRKYDFIDQDDFYNTDLVQQELQKELDSTSKRYNELSNNLVSTGSLLNDSEAQMYMDNNWKQRLEADYNRDKKEFDALNTRRQQLKDQKIGMEKSAPSSKKLVNLNQRLKGGPSSYVNEADYLNDVTEHFKLQNELSKIRETYDSPGHPGEWLGDNEVNLLNKFDEFINSEMKKYDDMGTFEKFVNGFLPGEAQRYNAMKNSKNVLDEAKGQKGKDKLFEPKILSISDCLKGEESEIEKEMDQREAAKQVSPMALFES